MMRETRPELQGIYVILGHEGAVERLDACLAAGVRLFQYRGKARGTQETARALVERCHRAEALLIVNDDVDLALAVEADGVHLGQEDTEGVDLLEVRARLGTRLLGLSTHDPAQARRAASFGADYIGAGSCFPTRTKDRVMLIGIDGLRRIVEASALPVAAIGGIDATNMASVRATGAAMAAVIGAIAQAGDPRAAAAQLMAAWNGAPQRVQERA